MKTKIAILAVLAIAVLAGSCVGTNALGVLDESVPPESLSHLEVRNNLTVVLWNNQPVEWTPEGLGNSRVTISLPPGEHSFTVRWTESQTQQGFTRSWYETRDIEPTTFLPGHSYRISQQRIWLIFFTVKNVRIKDVTK